MEKKVLTLTLLAISVFFFIMGLTHPILQSGFSLGPFRFQQDYIYLGTSYQYFFNQDEYFIGFLLLFFTIIFPIIKYIFILLTLLGLRIRGHHFLGVMMEIINKWAMLDVFVVAVLILNLKFNSTLIISKLENGTTFFGISVLLLMICSLIARQSLAAEKRK
ncbi:MAG TPA: paraquat-inducible protein A [Chitinophagaceae bacterium]|nr:paraquat-inducible protein A [Chitinophagaceae bacterium]